VPKPRRLILASSSPRRRELLGNAGVPFTVRTAPIVERALPGESPVDYAVRLAREKAAAAAGSEDEIVLGADTIVVIDDRILEKPADAGEAARMLRLLSGRNHEVITGICLRYKDGVVEDHERTRVHFLPLDEKEIADYVATGEPMDKAGAYAIQGRASRFIDRIEGCYFNVVGLPVATVWRHLKRLDPMF